MNSLITKYKSHMLIILIQFFFVRYLVLTPMNLNAYARYSHALIFVFLLFISFFTFFNKSYKITRFLLATTGLAALGWIMFFLQHLVGNYNLFYDVLPNFSATHLSLIFIPLIVFNYSKKEILHILNITTWFICFIGPLYFFVFYFLIYILDNSAAELLMMFFGEKSVVMNGQSYNLNMDNIRQIGFLMIHDRSGAGLTAAFYYQFYLLAQKIKMTKVITKLEIAFVIYCFTGIIYSTSLTVTIASIIMFGLITLYHFRLSLINISVNVTLAIYSIAIAFLSRGVWDRVKIVNKGQDFYVKSFLPGASGCVPKYMIWRPNTPEAITNLVTPCIFNEIFALWPIVKYGIIPILPWFIVFFSPLAAWLKFNFLSQYQKASLSLILSFWICGFHFSGAEFWGNNIVFFLAWTTLFMKDEDSK